MKAPVLPLLVGLSLCGIGGAMLYVYFRNKDEEEADRKDETDSNIISPGKTSTTMNGTPKKKIAADEKVMTREILVENEVAPIVVGRNLSNLKLIEESSGTTIWFKDKEDGKHQICFVKGKSSAVNKADDLIKDSIKKANRVTEEISVPQSACGKILGRCGDSLQEISRKSKAKVSIEAGERADGKTRRVLITGNQSQVNVAKLLIEDKVKEDAEARKLVEEAEAKREPRGGRTPTGLTPASSRESLPQHKFEKLNSTSSDGQLEVYVSAVASPAKFWLQIVGPQTSELDILVDTLTEYYSQTKNQEFHRIREPYLGQIVAAMFKHDGKWYRAEVISILPNEFNQDEIVLDLYFVDYGDSQYVNAHEIFELRTNFLMLRFQAIECFLAHIQPTDGEDPEIWDVHGITRFEELTHVGQWKKMLSRTVTYKERTKGDTRIRREGSPVPGVELYDSNEGYDINLADELVGEGFAVYTVEAQKERAHIMSYDSPTSSQSSSMYENFYGVGQNPSSSTKNDTNQNNFHSLTNGNNNINRGGSGDGPPAINDNDRFSAIFENTTNENYENIQKDSSVGDNRNSNRDLLNAERTNGNYINGSATISNGNSKKIFSKDWNDIIEEERRGVS